MTRPPTGLLLHLSGPLQSWGERSRFNQRDTSRAPTRSGLIGLIASALGRDRDTPIGELAALRFTTRIDRPGTLLRDFHTVGGGMPRDLTVITAEGARRGAGKRTVISERYYLQDAAFTVLVTAPEPELLHACGEALVRPHWPPYLGRRACPPNAPLLVAIPDSDPTAALIDLPLARTGPSTPTVRVEFQSDAPLTGPVWAAAPDDEQGTSTEAQDDPVSFASNRSEYRSRPVYRRHLDLPTSQCGGLGVHYLTRLSEYLTDLRTEGSPASP
ncbi:type I-E CRISPR-associated protein Cas5/CasD [Spirillospora sp. NPDC049652]